MGNFIVLIVSFLFAACLYLQMATASIYEGYQPGINVVKIFNPLLILLVMYLTVRFKPDWLGGKVITVAYGFRLPAIVISLTSLVIALVMLSSVSSHPINTLGPESTRALKNTLLKSLTQPRFSNRSLVFAVLVFIFSGLYAWVVGKLSR